MAQNNKTNLKQLIFRAAGIAISFAFAALVSDVFLWLFFVWDLLKVDAFLSLAAKLSGMASVAGNLAYKFPVEGLSLFRVLLCLWAFCLECAFFCRLGLIDDIRLGDESICGSGNNSPQGVVCVWLMYFAMVSCYDFRFSSSTIGKMAEALKAVWNDPQLSEVDEGFDLFWRGFYFVPVHQVWL